MSTLLKSLNAGNAAIQSNAIEAQRDPNDNDNRYSVGQIWVNTASEEVFFLVAFNAGIPTWIGTSAGTGTFTSLTVDPGPTELHGILDVDGNIDTPGVITLNADGGPTETIVIRSSQGTGNDSIQIDSTVGGIEIFTNATSQNILISAADGSVVINGNEDIDEAVQIATDGGVLSTIGINNLSGTNDATNPATAALHIASVLGGVSILGGKDFSVTGDLDSIITVTTGDLLLLTDTADLNLTATSGDVNIEATAGSINFTTGTDITYTTSGGIDLTAATASAFTVTDVGEDLTLQSLLGKARLFGGEAAADAVTIDSGGGFTIDGITASFITVTGAAQDLSVGSVGGSVNVIGTEASALAVSLQASDAAGGVDITSGTGGFAATTTGAFSIDGATASNVTVTGAAGQDLTLQAVGPSINILSNEAVADAIVISPTGASAGIRIAPAGTVGSIEIGNVVPTVARTTTMNGGTVATAVIDTINVGTGGVSTDAGATKTINIGSGTNLLGTQTVNISTGTAASGTKTVNVGNVDGLTAVNVTGVTAINPGGPGTTAIGHTGAAGGAVTISGGADAEVSVNNVAVAAAAGPAATVTVVNNSRVGRITFAGYTQAAAATLVLTLTNSFISATSHILAVANNVGANDAQMHVTRILPGVGTADITILNSGAAALNGNMTLSFWILS